MKCSIQEMWHFVFLICYSSFNIRKFFLGEKKLDLMKCVKYNENGALK